MSRPRYVAQEPDIFGVKLPVAQKLDPDPMSDPYAARIWEDEMMYKRYLATVPPPSIMDDALRARFNSRVKMFKVRIHELEALRENMEENMEERPPAAIGNELASIIWRHRILTRALFPIRDLPNEILGMIFDHVVYSHPIDNMKYYHAARAVLVQTCRRFRDIAYGYRALWRTVIFTDACPWKLSFRAISRAEGVPLTIGFGQAPVLPGASPVHATDFGVLLHGLILAAPQLREVTAGLCESSMPVFCTWLARNTRAFPCLQTLVLHHVNHRNRDGNVVIFYDRPPMIPLRGQVVVPNLRKIDLDGVAIDWESQSPTMFSNVKDLRLGTTYGTMPPLQSHQWSQILFAAASTLVRLDLRMFWVACEWNTPPPSVRVELPNLLELSIHYEAERRATEFTLAHIDAPRLIALNILSIRNASINFKSLCEQLTGRFPELRLFALRFIACHGPPAPPPVVNQYFAQFGRLLRSMPKLRVLKSGFLYVGVQALLRPLCVPELYLAPEELAAIAEKAARQEPFAIPICCPELEYLSIFWEYVGDPTGDVRDFALWLNARQQLGKQFPRVCVRNKTKFEQMKALLEQADIAPSVGEFMIVPTETPMYEEKVVEEEVLSHL
ncbi:hypothetical protein BD311DRAFT_746669 [Dichomitus squalens]|uniref:F-box domain-containing protein n=1 Tax=Dichomitus squalens TaxID=114155 RepID=A0A4Q9N3E6_9APHY|nr:hypothetical protein BD311DRAFT_746669 [Dichomitus squalens]